MSTMRFADEVVPRAEVEGVPSRRGKPEPKALKLATQIVDSLAGEWKPEQYHDTYAEELRTRIERKQSDKPVVEEDEAPAEEATVLDLMEALEKSVSAAKAARGSAPKKKAVPRKRVAKAKKSA